MAGKNRKADPDAIKKARAKLFQMNKQQRVVVNSSAFIRSYVPNPFLGEERKRLDSFEVFMLHKNTAAYAKYINTKSAIMSEMMRAWFVSRFSQNEKYVNQGIDAMIDAVLAGDVAYTDDALEELAAEKIALYENIVPEEAVHDDFKGWLVDQVKEEFKDQVQGVEKIDALKLARAHMIQDVIDEGINDLVDCYYEEGNNWGAKVPTLDEYSLFFGKRIKSNLRNAYTEDFDADIALITAAMYDRGTKLCEELNAQRKQIEIAMGLELAKLRFWLGVNQQDHNDTSETSIKKFIIHAGEDIKDYTLKKLRTIDGCKNSRRKRSKARIKELTHLKGAVLPEQGVDVYASDDYHDVAMEDAFFASMTAISAQVAEEIRVKKAARVLRKDRVKVKISDFTQAMENVSNFATPYLFGSFQTNRAQGLMASIQVKLEEKEGDSSYGEKLKKMVTYMGKEGVLLDLCAVHAEKYIREKEQQDTLPEEADSQTFVKASASNVYAYCEGVYKANGWKATVKKGAGVFPAFAAITGVISNLKKGITKAKTNQDFFSKPGASIVDNSVFTTLQGAVVSVGDFLGGIGIGLAIGGIYKLIKNILSAKKFYSAAKKEKLAVEKKLEDVDELSPDGVRLSTKLVGLRLTVNNKFRQIIACIVEVLKRVMGIVATVLKWLGVTYLAGLSLSLIKGVIHLCQNLYYIGRAIYKRMKGIKGLQRKQTAYRFVEDATKCSPNGEGDYAVELMLKSGMFNNPAVKGVISKLNYSVNPDSIQNVRILFAEMVEAKEMTEDFRRVMRDALFGLLSSKPTPQLVLALFPGLGGATTLTKVIAG